MFIGMFYEFVLDNIFFWIFDKQVTPKRCITVYFPDFSRIFLRDETRKN